MRFLDPNPNPAGGNGTSTVQGGSPGVLTFRANGAERQITIEEAISKYLPKAWAADENMREAAELRKQADAERLEAKSALTAKQAVARLRADPSDLEALRTTAEFLGLDGDAVSQLASQGGGPVESNDFASALSQMKEIPVSLLPKELRDLAKALQGGRNPIQEIDAIRGVHNKGVLAKGKETFKTALQKDPTFGTILRGSSKADTLVDKMWSTIERRVEDGEALTSVAQEVVEHYRDVYGVYDEAVSSLSGFDAPGALGGAPGAASVLSRLQPKAEPNFEDFAAAAAKDKSIDPVKEFLRATFGRGQVYDQVTAAD